LVITDLNQNVTTLTGDAAKNRYQDLCNNDPLVRSTASLLAVMGRLG